MKQKLKVENYTQKTCPHCGTRIDAGDNFCLECEKLEVTTIKRLQQIAEDEPPEPKGVKETIPDLYVVYFGHEIAWIVKASGCREAIRKIKETFVLDTTDGEWLAEELTLYANVRKLN